MGQTKALLEILHLFAIVWCVDVDESGLQSVCEISSVAAVLLFASSVQPNVWLPAKLLQNVHELFLNLNKMYCYTSQAWRDD